MDGIGPFSIPAGGSRTFEGELGTTETFEAETFGKTSSGTQVGNRIEWAGTITYNETPQSLNLVVTSTWFFLKIQNNTSNTLANLYVNYGLVSQTLDNISFGNGGPFNIGYYKAFSNGNVRVYISGTTSYYQWNQGTHYTLPNTENQVVTLTVN